MVKEGIPDGCPLDQIMKGTLENRQLFTQFLLQHDLHAMNTKFPKPAQKLVTHAFMSETDRAPPYDG